MQINPFYPGRTYMFFIVEGLEGQVTDDVIMMSFVTLCFDTTCFIVTYLVT